MKEPVRGRTCENCQHFIAQGFRACPYCKHPQSVIEEPRWGSSSERFGVGLLATVVVFIVMYIVLQSGDNASNERGAKSLSAWSMCAQFVGDRLKAPASAEYPRGYSQFVTATGSDTYRVAAYVDAQNAFGAKIRTPFVCEVRDEGARWHLESLQMTP